MRSPSLSSAVGLLQRAAAVLVLAAVVCGASVAGPTPASAVDVDCKEAPTPEVPGRGLTGYFAPEPETLPPAADPFVPDATTTIYEQYGYAGLRWVTYDLGCGADAARNPDAVAGTTVANWLMIAPKAGAAATGAVVGAAFSPTFMQVFDPLVTQVVQTLHDRLFEQWVPVALAALGLLLLWRSRRAPLSGTAAAVGWALLVLVLTASVFRWPLEAGRFVDQSVGATLGAVSGGLTDGGSSASTPAAVRSAANVHESLLYDNWLAGTLGTSDSPVAQTYGPVLFDAQALTWREAAEMRADPDRGREIIEAKQDRFTEAAERIKEEDPDAYEHLTGKRSDERLGYALIAGLGALCALPFLLVSSLLIIASFLVVRFAVMLFPAFATIGVFPAARGIVIGVGTTVAAALVNGIIFGITAAVTVRGMGILLDPASALPPWLALVLLLVSTLVLWIATKPFRRLTTMAPGGGGLFGASVSGLGESGRWSGRLLGRVGTAAVATATGNLAALGAATVAAGDDHPPRRRRVSDRAEAKASEDPDPPSPDPLAPTGGGAVRVRDRSGTPRRAAPPAGAVPLLSRHDPADPHRPPSMAPVVPTSELPEAVLPDRDDELDPVVYRPTGDRSPT